MSNKPKQELGPVTTYQLDFFSEMMENQMTNAVGLVKRAGDLLALAEQGEFDVIIHGCNCKCIMGGGIAAQIARRYPQIADADATGGHYGGDYLKLGNFTYGTAYGKSQLHTGMVNGPVVSTAFKVVNAYTQFEPSTGDDVFEYAAFELVLNKILYKFGPVRYGLPYIGMGLAKGDPNRIMPIIHAWTERVVAAGGSVTLVEFK